ncbi:MAG: hypothetical protein PQ964_05095 [Methanobacteriaceae archaeon]|jgi:predicted deacylase
MILISTMPVNAENNTTNNTTISVPETTNSTPYTISIFDNTVGADVTINPEIRNNIQNTSFFNKILEKQTQGSTIIRFGNGSGNRLLIWAGIHGNEEESNIATMNYLEYLRNFSKRNVLNGTIYVIPFGIPETTAINSRNFTMPYTYTERVRYRKGWHVRPVTRWVRQVQRVRRVINGQVRWVRQVQQVRRVINERVYDWIYRTVTRTGYRWVDPNRVANVPGTPGWRAVEFARNNGIRHILDVHSGGGLYNYPNGLIFATRDQNDVKRIGEKSWANHIANYIRNSGNSSNNKFAIYFGPGLPGMVRRHGHRYGIDTITLEVERDLGCTVHWANVLYRMIEAGTEYLFPQLRNT